MNIGEEVLIKGKIIDTGKIVGSDSNPQSAIKVEINGYIDSLDENAPYTRPVRFWIHRRDQSETIVKKD